MSRELRVAMAQVNPTVGDLKQNCEKIRTYIQRAQACGSHVVAFPELALCGYPPEDLLFKPHFIAANLSYLEQLIPCTSGIMAVVGFADREDGKVFNAAAVIANGRLVTTYHKILLPNYSVFDEKRYFVPGNTCPVVKLNNTLIGVTICEDIWDAYGPAREQALTGGASVLLNISASPYHQGKIQERRRMLSRRARSFQSTVCYVNLVGGQDELVFDGGSMICSPDGDIIRQGPEFAEDLIVADISADANPSTAGAPGHLKRREGRIPCSHLFVRATVKPSRNATPLASTTYTGTLGRIEGLYQALVMGTRDYVRKNNFTRVALGVSGGIDSALTAAIACDALGPSNVTGVAMPSRFSSAETQEDTVRIASSLGFELLVLPIEGIFKAYLGTLEDVFKGRPVDVAEENIQARIRGNLLMALSNKFGWLVLTTGNKSETSCGYCTLYGDMAGGFAVIKDVPKTTVYKLALHCNRSAKQERIPTTIIKRAPSAELREDQKDEDSLPPYPVLDSILSLYVEQDASATDIAECGFEPSVVNRVLRLVDQNDYKRRQSPPGIRITPKAFGRDRRIPITNRFCETLEQEHCQDTTKEDTR